MRYEIAEVVQAPGTTNPYLRGVAGRAVTINDLRGQPLTVYSAEAGVGTIPQPLSTDANGRIEGWVEAPDFDIVVAGPSGYSQPVRLSPPGELHVASYGAKGDDASNNDAALAALVAVLPVNGATIRFGSGTYQYTAFPPLDGKRSVTLKGQGGLSAGAGEVSVLKYTGAGAGSAISARSTYGLVIEDLALIHTNAGFTGTLLDLSGLVGVDTAHFRLDRVFMGGMRTALLINLNKAICGSFDGCVFIKGAPVVKGRATNGADYSNVISFRGCYFGESLNTTGHVRNGGDDWSFVGCTFEQTYTAAGASSSAGAYAYDDVTIRTNGVSFIGCYFGDANDTGTWIAFTGNGLHVSGCTFAHAVTAISTGGSSFGIDISGNHFTNCTTAIALGGNPAGVTITGNNFVNGGITAAATVQGLVVMGNKFQAGVTPCAIDGTGAIGVIFLGNDVQAAAQTTVTYTAGGMPKGSLIQRGGNQIYGLGVFQNAGPLSDAAYPATPPDGAWGVDTTNKKIGVRIAGAWYHTAALT